MILKTAAPDAKLEDKALGLDWIGYTHPVAATDLAQILEKEARVHIGREAPTGEKPSFTIFSTNGVEGLAEGVNRIREVSPDTPILVFGLHLDLQLAQNALRLGARGFVDPSSSCPL